MNEAQSEFLDIHQLRIGLYIELELGWMSHPFPMSSFKISSDKQIEIIQGLGLKRVRYVPGKSDLADGSSGAEVLLSVPSSHVNGETESEQAKAEAEALRLRKQNRDLLASQQRDMAVCAYFSDRGRLLQADRGRRFSAIVDA